MELVGNGRPGMIDDLRAMVNTLRTEVSTLGQLVVKAKSMALGGFVALMLVMVASGSGTISLKSLLEVLK
jgi:hypothetical protein